MASQGWGRSKRRVKRLLPVPAMLAVLMPTFLLHSPAAAKGRGHDPHIQSQSPSETQTQSGELLGPRRLAFKLAFSLLKTVPSREEIQRLTVAHAQGQDAYWAAYLDLKRDYLTRPEFQGRLGEFFEGWFGLPPTESVKEAVHFVLHKRSLFEAFDNNLLFLNGLRAAAYLDVGVEFVFMPPLEEVRYVPLELMPGEDQARSILSNLDFLDQFPDTSTNFNRKRSKEVFERFLCSPMTPDKLPDDYVSDDPPDPHNLDPSCVGCHYKLDPMARFFDRWKEIDPSTGHSVYDPSFPGEGAIVLFNESTGAGERSPGAGIRDLSKMIVARQDFRECAIKRAFSFFTELQATAPQDFVSNQIVHFAGRGDLLEVISGALEHPWFVTTDPAPALTFGDVQSHFKTCQSSGCHGETTSGRAPYSFERYPFAEDPEFNQYILNRVWTLVNTTDERVRMPKPPIAPISGSSLKTIQSWIESGAHTKDGGRTLDQDGIRDVLSGKGSL